MLTPGPLLILLRQSRGGSVHDFGGSPFADFGGAGSGTKRLYPAPGFEADATNNNTPGTSHRGRAGFLERETGLEPATLSLGM
jgi:hypothetical protein